MRLFPRKAVILIPLAPYRKACFWLLLSQPTKVTPAERTDKNHLHGLPTKEQHKIKIRTGGARSRPRTLPVALFTHKGATYNLRFTRLQRAGCVRAPQATPLRILPEKVTPSGADGQKPFAQPGTLDNR